MRTTWFSNAAWIVLIAAAVLVGLPGTSHAQRFTGELSGTVVDETGAVVPAANVTLANESSGDARRTVDQRGRLLRLRGGAGRHLHGHHPDDRLPEPRRSRAWPCAAGTAARCARSSLAVGGLTEAVAVTAETPIVPLDSGEKSATLVAEQIENIPIVEQQRGRAAAHPARPHPRHPGRHEPARVHRRGHRDQRQRRVPGRGREQPERDRQLQRERHPHAVARHHARRRARRRPRLQLRDLREPEHRVRAGVQGPAEQLRGRTRQGPQRDVGDHQVGRPRVPRLALHVFPRLPPELERVVREQGRPRARGEQVRLPGRHPLRARSSRTRSSSSSGYEYYRQRLDTGFVRSWVPTEAMLRRRLPERRVRGHRQLRQQRAQPAAAGSSPPA